MTMIAKFNCIVTFAGLAMLIAGCATDPRLPSLPSHQFVVLVKGEPVPLKAFEDFIAERLSATLKDCKKTLPPPSPRAETTKSDEPRQLAYQCAPAEPRARNAQLALFAEAYGNSIASLLEMKITTTAGCVAQRCYGGPLRYWYQTPPCTYVC